MGLFLKNEVLGVEMGQSVGDNEAFTFVRAAPGDERLVINVNHIASGELNDLAGLGLILQIEFTLDDVYDRWAMVLYRDRLAGVNLEESCHQTVRFVRRDVLIESVDLDVIVVFVWAAVDVSLSLSTWDMFVRHVDVGAG